MSVWLVVREVDDAFINESSARQRGRGESYSPLPNMEGANRMRKSDLMGNVAENCAYKS